MHHDLIHHAKTFSGLTSVASTGAEDINGKIIDTKDFESGMVSTDVTAWTVGDINVKEILESDDSGMSGAVAIPAARLIGADQTALGAVGIQDIGFVRTLRYVRPVFQTVGASVGATLQATVVLGNAVETIEV
ncbi:MAG: hypothetical protein DRH97_00205 [Chloroflexi bacterium]|nr:MAG: hypothetical protein DRH97_00205 [Chloroflexota bacterium]